ncbi:MAG: DUF418 domain-containing protein [Flavobacteriaceae bacterium]|nr:DUF418 domain-containing protein [Flavobacteriaceae bacterium]
MSHTTTNPSKRIQSIDALRGFALAGIVFVHMVEQYTAGMIPEDWQTVKNAGLIDQIIEGAMFIIIRGKFFALFSLLFGLSFFIQMDRAAKKGMRFEGRFLWRLVILFIIGAVHQMFYSGDILTIYAVVGLLILPFYKVKNKYILIVAFVFLFGIARFVTYAITGVDDIFPLTGKGDEEYWEILKTGSILEVFHINSMERMLAKINFQIGFFGRGGLTLGFFLLGLWIGKTRIIEAIDKEKDNLNKIMKWSLGGLGIFLILTPVLFMLHGQNQSMDSWVAMLALTSYDQFNLSFTFVIAIGFLLLFNKDSWQRRLIVFAPYGRMALTNYFLQSVIGTYILFGWGLGYVGEIRNYQMFIIAIVVIILQMLISKWWLSKFRYGPLEWLWRSATYLKWQPFKK